MIEKKGFIIYTSYYEILKDIPNDKLGLLFRAIFEYQVNGKEIELTNEIKMAFSFIKNQFKIDNQKYNEIQTKRSEAGKIGMDKRWQNHKKHIEKSINNNKNNKCYSDITKITRDNKHNYKEEVEVDVAVDVDVDLKDDVVLKEDVNKKEVTTKRHISVNFVKPSLLEIKNYITQEKLSVNPEIFKDHYESNGWKVGKVPMKDWKATLRNWDRKTKEVKKPFKNEFLEKLNEERTNL